MLVKLIKWVFEAQDVEWTVSGARLTPTEDDIRTALDRAAQLLYDKEVGTTLTVLGLHIVKTDDGHEVFVHVGGYK